MTDERYKELFDVLLMMEREHISLVDDGRSQFFVCSRNGVPRMTLREAVRYYERGTTA